MRGSSAILGAVDYTLLAEEGKGASTIKVEKMRDGSNAPALKFKLVEVVIGKDEDDEDVTSCIVRPVAIGDGLDLTVDEHEEVPLRRCGDKREHRVEMLIGAVREEAERTCRADDEELSDVGLSAVELARLLNQARQHCCTLDGKLSASFTASKMRIRMLATGATVSRPGGLTGSTSRLTGGGSASLNVKDAFIVNANGGRFVAIRKGTPRLPIKGIYAETPSTALGQSGAAAQVAWQNAANDEFATGLSAETQKQLRSEGIPYSAPADAGD